MFDVGETYTYRLKFKKSTQRDEVLMTKEVGEAIINDWKNSKTTTPFTLKTEGVFITDTFGNIESIDEMQKINYNNKRYICLHGIRHYLNEPCNCNFGLMQDAFLMLAKLKFPLVIYPADITDDMRFFLMNFIKENKVTDIDVFNLYLNSNNYAQKGQTVGVGGGGTIVS